jgi:outer membrane protein OmpA-like peptidoglycan-associated protein
MNKIIILLVTLVSLNMRAQDMMGFQSSNWAGVYNVGFNPAEIADSRYKLHINVISTNFRMSNNFVSYDGDSLFHPEVFGKNWFQSTHLKQTDSKSDKEAYIYNKINGPLSFMWSINKKNSVAVTYNLNTLINVDGVSDDFARFMYNNKDANFYKLTSNNYFNFNTMMYADIGVTYARELMNTQKGHYLKGGLTGKYNIGIANMFLFGKDLEVSIKDKDHLKYLNGTVSTGNSYFPFIDNISGNASPQSEIDSLLSHFNGGGFGLDAGLVYEFRDDTTTQQYQMDCKKWWRNDKNKYKYKIGVSVVDLGYVNYTRNSNNPFSGFFADKNYATDIDLNRFQAIKNGMKALQDTLAKDNVFLHTAASSTYNLNTPTRINMYFDYRMFPWLYLNFTASIAPWRRNGNATTHHVTEFSITPRIEFKYFGFYFPVSTNKSGYTKFGTSMRLGPVVLGSNNILPLLTKGEYYGVDFFAGASIPILQPGKKKDKDKDGISNKKDKCNGEVGTCENGGCPEKDTDKDGTIDKLDKCPLVAGIPALNGCPDMDGDMITDTADKCPDVAGLVALGGCPDKDKDGITDKEDKCPDLAGIKEFAGCPDTDKDGIQDSDDACPTEAGVKSGKGCPDQDGDGTVDKLDKCVDVAGPADNMGCPFGDTDKDGLNDNEDDCPKLAGPKDNKGCPKQEVKVVEKVVEQTPVEKAADIAFENLRFETSRDLIKKESYESLDKLVEALKSQKGYKIAVSGHTDNAGNSAVNLSLSDKRAKAVKKYLVSKGINAAAITAKGYGDTVPVGDNATEEGKAQNRRVELKVTF